MSKPRIIADLAESFGFWQRRYQSDGGRGLAWYLAAELCDRFYASHGIAPITIAHEGLGYYGIALEQLPCAEQRGLKLGRLTAAGDIENWQTGSPGDHGLKLVERVANGEDVAVMLVEAVRFLGLPTRPTRSHPQCRHRRWGASFQLVFRIAALLTLRWDDRVQVWNDPAIIRRRAAALDPDADMREHPGYFLFEANDRSVLVAGDGRVLSSDGSDSWWSQFMAGKSITNLVQQLEGNLGLTQ